MDIDQLQQPEIFDILIGSIEASSIFPQSYILEERLFNTETEITPYTES